MTQKNNSWCGIFKVNRFDGLPGGSGGLVVADHTDEEGAQDIEPDPDIQKNLLRGKTGNI
jgi:hypothetical protein